MQIFKTQLKFWTVRFILRHPRDQIKSPNVLKLQLGDEFTLEVPIGITV